MPAQPHWAVADTRSMGLHHQQCACSLLEGNVRHQDDAHTLVAEREELHRCCLAIVKVELQPTPLRVAHRPILHVTAGAR